MIAAIVAIVIMYILYILLIKGLLWKIILGIFGWAGMYWFLQSIYETKTFGIVISDYMLSWSTIIPTIVISLAMLYTKE